jgi:YbgC/YbaW family acyl-CoA thioester hydrolase
MFVKELITDLAKRQTQRMSKFMAYEFTSIRRVEFSETDMAGLVHFSNYFRYMETAERDFFESLGLNLILSKPGEMTGWPRIRAECKFSAPLRFGDTIEIHLAVKTIKDRSIDYQFRIFSKQKDGNRVQAAKAHITTVFSRLDENGEIQSMEIPPEVRSRITEAPANVLARPLDLKTS